MKQLSIIFALVGAIITVLAIVGRFYGPPTVFGFQAAGVLTLANTCLLAALVANLISK